MKKHMGKGKSNVKMSADFLESTYTPSKELSEFRKKIVGKKEGM